ncbi:DUF3971 domain-containing protein [Pseudoroseomonas globiformis]|uniref:DUF3971 domain-containing protein n=1 Tax=Teichococcus globiformis TaxID=2307229 RepID=A0ABV7G517_9PROT
MERTVPGLSLGSLALAWSGFQAGAATPFEVRASDATLRDDAGVVQQALPDLAIRFSTEGLLRGRLVPVSVTLRDPRIVLERGMDGELTVSLGRTSAPQEAVKDGPPLEVLELFRPGSLLAELTTVDLSGGSLIVLDRQLHRTWIMRGIAISLFRTPGTSEIAGQGRADLELPGDGPDLAAFLSGKIQLDGTGYSGSVTLPLLQPHRLALLMPALKPAALLEAPVSLTLSAQGRKQGPEPLPELSLALTVGSGRLTAHGHDLRFKSLNLHAHGTPETLRLERLRLELASSPGVAAGTEGVVIEGEGEAALRDDAWQMRLQLRTGPLNVTTLGSYWPGHVAEGARQWILSNMTSGKFDQGRFLLQAQAKPDLSQFEITGLDGSLNLVAGTIHWLRPIPPLEQVVAKARFGLKNIVIHVSEAQQAGTGLVGAGSVIRLTQLDGNNEQAEVDAQLRGPVPDVVGLIRHPRLRLFEQRPLELKEPGGQVDGRLHLAFPLKADVPAEAFKVLFRARLTELRIADVVMNKALERGTADLVVDNQRLSASGRAQLSGIPATLNLEMDFRPGPASQVVERVRATARPDAGRIAEFGLDLDGFVSGPIGVQVLMEKRRGGQMDVLLDGDLQQADMRMSPLAWRKANGVPASAQGQLNIADGEIRSVSGFRVEAPGLSFSGRASFAPRSRLDQIDIREARIFASRFSGQAWPPTSAGAAWRLRASGPVLDLGPLLASSDSEDEGSSGSSTSAPVSMDGHFDHVLLGEGRSVSGVQGRAAVDGRGIFREARLVGQAGNDGGFDLVIVPRGAGRDLRINANNAGALLRAFDITRQVEGGRLSLEGRWDSNQRAAKLSGTADMSDFRFQDAAAAGKLLQALTVYGVIDAVRGPGLAFGRMVAPFTLTRSTLTIEEARAFSSSLGLTARGAILRQQKSVDLQGTIVPAYAINSILGYIPLLGRLFSPEQGGGLFAATWRMQGPLADPSISVNPLAALTPGFLRSIFGEGGAASQQDAR